MSPRLSAEIPLRAFDANYDLYQGGMHIAVTRLRLQPAGENWRFSMKTTARGVFSWFTDKSPYAETRFMRHGGNFRLQEVRISEANKKTVYESASFDWDKNKIDVRRKGKSKRLGLAGNVYDYQSIHLLAAAMGQQNLEKMTVDFYRKGNLVKSRLVFVGPAKVKINGEAIEARVYEQVIVRSNSKMKYYYDAANPLLPLRIEKLESGDSPKVLTLTEVSWGS